MRRTLIMFAALAALVIGIAAPAGAKVDRYVNDYDQAIPSWMAYVPICDGGEAIYVSGTQSIHYEENLTPGGIYQIEWSATWDGVTGVGQTSGKTYTLDREYRWQYSGRDVVTTRIGTSHDRIDAASETGETYRMNRTGIRHLAHDYSGWIKYHQDFCVKA